MVIPGRDTSPETNARTEALERFLEDFPAGEIRNKARHVLALAFSEGVEAGMEAVGAMHTAIAMSAASAAAEQAGSESMPRPVVRIDIPPTLHAARAKFRAVIGIEANPYEDALKTVTDA